MSQINITAPITKTVIGDDGNLYAYGKMTGPDLDLDQQRCDPDWLKKAVPEWFESGGNIRQMHMPIAVGKGIELDQQGDDFWLGAKIVAPDAIKLVDEGVLSEFSIGIKRPQIVKDGTSPGGRIVGGIIIETSLVDRGSNSTCKFVLAKMAGGALEYEQTLLKDANAVDAEIGDVDGGGGDGSEDPTVAVDYIAIARDALNRWLADEALELAEGKGGRFVIRLICNVLEDLDWAVEADAYDDAAAALEAVKAALTTPLEDPEVINLTTVADLVKAAVADTATDIDRAAVAELRKALELDGLDTKIATAVTEATSALQETVTGLSADVAKVSNTVDNSGPSRVRIPEDLAKAALVEGELQKLAQYEHLANSTTDPTAREGYRILAERLRATVTPA